MIRPIAALTLLLLIGAGIGAQRLPARYSRYAEVQSAITSYPDLAPPELRTATDNQHEARWSAWIAGHDREIRARLAQGDEDTIINWMLFGASFTSQPPAVSSDDAANPAAESRRVAAVMRARARDLVEALAAPKNDERRLFARKLLERRHLSFDSDAGRAAALQYLVAAVVRVAGEQARIDRELDAARTAAEPARQVEIGSRLFRTRGLSLDTSLPPNYALDQALTTMKAGGRLRNGDVTHVAIVGPGLDFSDKDSGFDFYPPQSLQPFAVLDSLRRLQLGRDPEAVLLDISPRVIDHVARARARAAKAESYALYLPLARHREWLPAFRYYWEHFGDQIGSPIPARTPKDVSGAAELRAIRLPPRLVQQLTTSDLNIVTERLDGEPFDLIVATNVFVYYDLFDQALAMANIGAMLRPGGFLLSNNLMPESEPTLRLVGSSETPYWVVQRSTEGTPTTFGDHVFWYQRSAEQRR